MKINLSAFPAKKRLNGLLLINSLDLRGLATVRLALPEPFTEFELIYSGVRLSAPAVSFSATFSSTYGNTLNYGSNYADGYFTYTGGGATAGFGSASTSGGVLMSAPDNDAGWCGSGNLMIFRNNRSLFSTFLGQALSRDNNRGATEAQGIVITSTVLSTLRPNSIIIVAAASVFVTGRVMLLAYENKLTHRA